MENSSGAMARIGDLSDGESKKWTIDQFGRLALSGGTEGYAYDEDVMSFNGNLNLHYAVHLLIFENPAPRLMG